MLTTKIILDAIFFGSLLLTSVFAIGVVWRTEKELDASYKTLSLAVFFLLGSEISMRVSPNFFAYGVIFSEVLMVLFAMTLLVSVYLMRDLIRREDGEIASKQDLK